jgi:hypothetical protein
MTSKVVLKIDDREIRLNPFVQKVLQNVIGGLIEALDEVPLKREKIEIVIDK